MVTTIQYKLLKIPVMLLNFYNSEYSQEALHQFSNCCLKRVKHKKVCSSCLKELNVADILKGTDEEHMLTEKQQDDLKNLLENQTIQVLGFEEFMPEKVAELLPFVKSSKIILPSINKGFKQSDFVLFYSFKEALKESGFMCLVKYTTRGKEHLGYILFYNSDMVFIEIPFSRYYNFEQIDRLKDSINFEKIKIKELTRLKKDALSFIKKGNVQVNKDELESESKKLLKVMLSNIIDKKELKKKEIEIENPFV
jgi:non-homologous end joining protein Ku